MFLLRKGKEMTKIQIRRVYEKRFVGCITFKKIFILPSYSNIHGHDNVGLKNMEIWWFTRCSLTGHIQTRPWHVPQDMLLRHTCGHVTKDPIIIIIFFIFLHLNEEEPVPYHTNAQWKSFKKIWGHKFLVSSFQLRYLFINPFMSYELS